MANECPDCNKLFFGKKCGCGYVLKSAERTTPIYYCRFHAIEPAVTKGINGMPLCRTCYERNEDRPEFNKALANVKAERERLGLSGREFFEMMERKHGYIRPEGSRDWARKILQRSEDGDRIPQYAVNLAREALR